MKKNISIILSIIIVIVAIVFFYVYFPVKKMPVTNSNTINCIKDDDGIIEGFKLGNKEYYKYNSDSHYIYNYGKEGLKPLDYNIQSYYLQFKKYPSNNPLYDKKYKSLFDLKSGYSFNLAYENIIIEDTHILTTAIQRFNFYKTNDMVFPEFKSENIEKIEVLNGIYGNTIELYRGVDSPDDAIFQAVKNEYKVDIIDVIDKTNTIEEFLKMYKETGSSENFSQKNYLAPNVYYRISFKDEKFPMWLVCK